jgi:nucleotide-binding universal stress UspA family protein
MYKKILVGYDGSDGAKLALDCAVELAKELNAELWAMWARSSLPHYPETIDEVEEEKDAAIAFFKNITRDVLACSKEHGLEIKVESRSGHAAQTILSFAQEGGFDLIVLGNRGHSGAWGRFLGHTADRISENAHCSVLIVRK